MGTISTGSITAAQLTVSGKVTLPVEVANEVKAVERTGYLASYKLQQVLEGDRYPKVRNFINPNYGGKKENLIILANALTYGYEVEKTAEDKLRDYYNEATRKANDYGFSSLIHKDGVFTRSAIRTTLDLLGKKIKGIND
jgi:hypothetical protein